MLVRTFLYKTALECCLVTSSLISTQPTAMASTALQDFGQPLILEDFIPVTQPVSTTSPSLCAVCHAIVIQSKKCSGCKDIIYCSKECQVRPSSPPALRNAHLYLADSKLVATQNALQAIHTILLPHSGSPTRLVLRRRPSSSKVHMASVRHRRYTVEHHGVLSEHRERWH
jgi:hypothetical protein